MEGSLTRIGVHVFPPEVGILQLVSVQRSRDIDVFSADADHLLTVQQLLCKDGSQATKKVTPAVHHNLLLEGHGPGQQQIR